MRIFYKKTKYRITMMVVLAMLLQIIGPVVSNYVYAEDGVSKDFVKISDDGNFVMAINLAENKATVNWKYTFSPDVEKKYSFESNFILAEGEEKSGNLEADGTIIGEYTIFEDGKITIDIDENIEEIVKKLLEGPREESVVPVEETKPEVTEKPNEDDKIEGIDETEDTNDSEATDKTEDMNQPDNVDATGNTEESMDEEPVKDLNTDNNDITGDTEEPKETVSIIGKSLGLVASASDIEGLLSGDETHTFEGSFVVHGVEEKHNEPNLLNMMGVFGNIEVEVPDTIITKITATSNGENIADIEDYRPTIGDKVDLRIDFTLPEKHNYGNSSKLEYILPEPLKAAEGTGELTNDGGEKYADFYVQDGKVIIVFNDNIRFEGEEGSQGLKTEGYFDIKAIYEKGGDDNSLVKKIKLPGVDEITLNFKPKGGEVITKSVDTTYGDNIHELIWTVYVNTEMEDLGEDGVVFTDKLEGKHKYKKDSLVVTKLEIGADGDTNSQVDVSTDYTALAEDNLTEFTLTLKGKYAYKIEYKTILDDTDEAKEILKNGATFKGTTKNAQSTIKFGDPLTKSVTKDGEKAHWTIKVNGNKKSLPANLMITDTWNDTMKEKHKLSGDIVVTNSSGVQLTKGTDYTVNPDPVVDTGFVLTFLKPIVDEHTIKYTTVPKDLITDGFTVSNMVVRSDRGTDIKGDSAGYGQNVIKKSYSGPNYQDKTITWTIEVNSAGYIMNGLKLEDVFTHENLKVSGDIDINYGSNTNVTHNITYKTDKKDNKGKGGFDIEFTGTITDKIIITYITDYDVRGVDNLKDYENKGKITWKTEEKDYSAEHSASVEINTQQEAKGYKTGQYNYEEKKFQWSIGINYNFDTVTNATFTDKLPDSQIIDRGSIKIHKLNLSAGGNGSIIEPALVEGSDYTLTPAGSLEKTFTIVFLNQITEAYRISYESRTKDDYYPPSTENYKVTNNAILIGDNDYSGKWDKTVTVEHSKKLITKSANLGSTAKLNWELKLNYGQSTLDDVVITDIVGTDNDGNPNQKIYEDSFKVYEVSFNGTSPTPIISTTPILPGGGLYDVKVDEEGFKITFNHRIDKAYLIKYETYFLGSPGDKLENKATLSYTTSKVVDGSDEGEYYKEKFEFSGRAFTKKGQLEITKVDSAAPDKRLSGAIFELWSDKVGGFLIERVSTDVNGVYAFNTKVGQTNYYYRETKAPEGYSLDNNFKEVWIKDESDPPIANYVHEITVENHKIHQAVKLIKTDEDGDKLSGAVFTLHNQEDNRVKVDKDGKPLPESFTTDENGEIFVNNLAVGTYYFKEIKPPTYYILPIDTKVSFTISEGQLTVTQIKMKNAIGKGSIVVKKVDSKGNVVNSDVEAIFELSKNDDTSFETITKTTKDGSATFSDLLYGVYILREKQAPNGYVRDVSEKEIVLNGKNGVDGTIINDMEKEIEFINHMKDYSVRLIKYNSNKRLRLEGAVFRLEKELGTTGVYEEVKIFATQQLTTDEKGEIYLDNLSVGKYRFIEIRAPRGYDINRIPIEFEIEENQIATIELEKINRRSSDPDPTDPNPPTKPTDPDPKEPTDPEKPVDPEKPTEPPTEPVVPVDPTKPTEPVDPTNPVDPTDPTETTDPEKPTVPTEPTIKEKTPKEKPVVIDPKVPEGSTPKVVEEPKNGKVTFDENGRWIYTPNPDFVGKDSFVIRVTHPDGTEEDIFIEIDVEDPLGGIEVATLPKTGQVNSILMYLAGLFFIVLGIVLRRKTA